MSDQYAVVGNPISHSKSPLIHRMFAQQTGQDLEYQTLEAPLDGFEQAILTFFAQQADQPAGLNITVPFKQQAWEMAAQLSGRAQRAGAVNTLYRDESGQICGDTTDGVGLVRDLLDNQGATLKDARVLILGAGGAVRGVLEPILEQSPALLVVANRTASKAEQLAQDFAEFGELRGCGFAEVEGQFDLIINGTSASLQGELPPLPAGVLKPGGWCYDMMYGAEPTPFMVWGEQQEAGRVIDGLGMLVEQAAESFRIWRGVRPQSAAVIDAVRAQLGS
ncbi:shikimate dehydrogenase [Motiliproteus sp.]|uniref:shikimate dehydrogenase n=1 Tax=Motiliproteus sp. TaxID=1898955 RepID=UPI003BABDCE9